MYVGSKSSSFRGTGEQTFFIVMTISLDLNFIEIKRENVEGRVLVRCIRLVGERWEIDFSEIQREGRYVV